MPDNNSKQVARHINSIPFGNIIGGPLSACITAQKDAALTTLQSIKEITMVPSDVEYGSSRPVSISFTFQIEGKKKTMIVPLLTIVPIPYIHIDHVDLSFTANITSCSKTSIEAAYTAPNANVNGKENSETNVQNIIRVDIHATTSDMPPGVAKLLDVFGNQLIEIEQLSPEEVEFMRNQTSDLNTLGYLRIEHRLVSDIYSVSATHAKKLSAYGIKTVKDYLDKAATPTLRKRLARSTGISEALILRWSNYADLMRVPHVGPELAALLEAVGVDTVKELRHRVAGNLKNDLESTNRRKNFVSKVPSSAELKKMIDKAYEQKPLLEY